MLEKSSGEYDLAKDLPEDFNDDQLNDLSEDLSPDLPKDLQTGLSEELIKELEEELSQNLDPSLTKNPEKEHVNASINDHADDLSADFTEDLTQGMSENTAKDVSEDFVKEGTHETDNRPLRLLSDRLFKSSFQKGSRILSHKMMKGLENNSSQDLSHEISSDISEDLISEQSSVMGSTNLKSPSLEKSFKHYSRYTSRKPRSGFFNFCMGIAKLCLFFMLLPFILLILSAVGGVILSSLIIGIGFIASSLVVLVCMAFYSTALTKTIILLMISFSITLFSFGLLIVLLIGIFLKKLINLAKNYYQHQRTIKEADVR